MAAYVAAVSLTSWAFNSHLVHGAAVIPVALLPMVPAVLTGLASIDGFRSMDELQRKVQSESILFAFFITAVLTFSYGFLEVNAGFPRVSMFFVWPVLAVAWMIAAALATKRYR